MSTMKTDTPPAMAGWFGFPPFQMLPLTTNPLAAQAKLGQAMCASAMAFNQELARFTSQRLTADAGLFQAISQCASLDEAVTAQSDFARQAMESYMAEMPKLMEQTVRDTASLWAAAVGPDETGPRAGASS